MAVAFGKRNQFGLNGWAVARADALYLSVVERRVFQSAAEDSVYFRVCITSPTGELWKLPQGGYEGESVMKSIPHGIVARLVLHVFEVYGASIDADRCSGLHPLYGDAFSRN